MPSRAIRDACGAVSPQGRARLPTWPTWPNWPNGPKPARAPGPGSFLEKRAGPGEASPGRQGAAAWACVQGGRPRAGQGTAQAGMRDGQESLRGRACALAGRAGKEDAVYGRPGEAPAPHWKRAPGPLGAGRARRVLVALDGARGAAGRRLQGTGDESAGPALAGAGRGPCPHPVPSRRHARRSQAGSGAVQPAPARQVPARPWRLRGLPRRIPGDH